MSKQMSKKMSLDVPPASPLRGTSPLRGRKASFKVEHGENYHTILVEEQHSFTAWINKNMKTLKSVQHLMPLADNGEDLYEKIEDGIILCELINIAIPNTINNKAINKPINGKINLLKRHENLNLAISSAQIIGCTTVNMDPHTLIKGQNVKHIILGLIWQIIAKYLMSGIHLQNVPGLILLLKDGETNQDPSKFTPEQILLRWVNYQLQQANSDRSITNFCEDIKDCVVYSILLDQIAPLESGVDRSALKKKDPVERAEQTLKQASKIGCREFVKPNDIAKGIEKLNLAFVANMFNKHPALEIPEKDEDLLDTGRDISKRSSVSSDEVFTKKIVPGTDEQWFVIESKLSGGVLKIDEKTKELKTSKFEGSNNQLWTWKGNSLISKSGFYLGEPKDDKSIKAGSKVKASDSDAADKIAEWKMERCKLISTLTGMALDIKNGSIWKNEDIILWPPAQSKRVDSQSWVLASYHF